MEVTSASQAEDAGSDSRTRDVTCSLMVKCQTVNLDDVGSSPTKPPHCGFISKLLTIE